MKSLQAGAVLTRSGHANGSRADTTAGTYQQGNSRKPRQLCRSVAIALRKTADKAEHHSK